MRFAPYFFAILSVAAVCTARAQETVTEPSTGLTFPTKVTARHEGKEYSLSVTGTAVRYKYIFKIYAVAHYVQGASGMNSEEEACASLLRDGKAKELSMVFLYDVPAEKMRETYLEGFKTHTSAEQFKAISPSVNQYLGFFTKDVKENDPIVLQWLPGGIISAIIQGREEPAITDSSFAIALWSIWFGNDPVVDRAKLVERLVRK